MIDSLYWVKDQPPAALVLDGEVVLDVGDGWVSRNALVQADTAVQRLILRNSVFQGRYAQKLAMRPVEETAGWCCRRTTTSVQLRSPVGLGALPAPRRVTPPRPSCRRSAWTRRRPPR